MTTKIIINLTPHELTLCKTDGSVIERIPSSGVIRVHETSRVVDSINGIDIIEKVFGDLEGLPEPQDGVVYYVSAIAAQAAKTLGRKDILLGGDSVRNDKGQIIGITSFARMI